MGPSSTSTPPHPSHRRRPSWLMLFEGAVPYTSAFLGLKEHLALASTCRVLQKCWPAQSGLTELGIYLDRVSLPGPTAVAASSSGPLQPASPNKPPRLTGSITGLPPHPQQPPHEQPWSSLSRLMQHWSHLETLRFTGSISGPQEDLVHEALVTLPLALQTQSPKMASSAPTVQKPVLFLPRLKRLLLSKIGLLPFNASCIAAALVGPLGSGLEELDLSRNALKDEGLVIIFKAIAASIEPSSGRRRRRASETCHSLASLRRLDISHTQCAGGGLRALLAALGKGAMPNLRCLVVAGNALRDDGGMVLAGMIEGRTLPQLEVLDVTACGMGPLASKALLLSGVGGGMQALTSLYVGSNYIDSVGVEALAQAMAAGQLPRLAHLRLDLSGDLAVATLAAAWRGVDPKGLCPEMSRLDLAKNASLSGQAWHEMLTMPGGGLPAGLRELNLAQCKRMGELGLGGLVTWGARQPQAQSTLLTFLDLSNTGLGSAGDPVLMPLGLAGLVLPQTSTLTRYLEDLLVVFSSLETLVLRENRLGVEGVQALAHSMTRCGAGGCRLKVLDLSETMLGDAGVAVLATALSSCPRLTGLCLTANWMERQGWRALVQALGSLVQGGKETSGLRVLDVSKNPLGPGALCDVVALPEERRSLLRLLHNLRGLRMAWTELGQQDVAVLVSMLQEDEPGSPGRSATACCSLPLAVLDLAYCPQVGHAGASQLLHLALTPRLAHLRTLSLVGTGLGDAFIIQLMALMNTRPWAHWLHLDLLDLRANEVSKEVKVTFQGHVSRLRTKLVADCVWGHSHKLQGLVKIGSS